MIVSWKDEEDMKKKNEFTFSAIFIPMTPKVKKRINGMRQSLIKWKIVYVFPCVLALTLVWSINVFLILENSRKKDNQTHHVATKYLLL